jgi:hypothetical protein
MILDVLKLTTVMNELIKLEYWKHGYKIMLATGSDLFENKTLMAEYLKVGKASDAEKTINVFLENFEKDFPVVGQDMKDGSKKVGVMILIPQKARDEFGRLVKDGYKLYDYAYAIRELTRLKEKG